MLYVFLDEAGDLGFSDKASKHFVIATLTVTDPVPVRRIFKKIRQRKLKKKLKQLQEFKFSSSDDFIKELVLRRLAALDVEITYVLLKKKMVFKRLQDKQNILYNYLSGFLIERLASRKEREFKIVVDRLFSKINREEFNRYLKAKASFTSDNMGKFRPKIDIEHVDSTSEPCLQAVDFVAGAVFSKYEREDNRYIDIIKEKIRENIERW